jgi:hypothetical protein
LAQPLAKKQEREFQHFHAPHHSRHESSMAIQTPPMGLFQIAQDVLDRLPPARASQQCVHPFRRHGPRNGSIRN